MSTRKKQKYFQVNYSRVAVGTALGAVGIGAYFFLPAFLAFDYESANENKNIETAHVPLPVEKPFVATHLATPLPLKGIYMTSWVAGTSNLRQSLVKLIEQTELNAVVIDIKDYTGKVAFKVNDPMIDEVGSIEERIVDLRKFIEELHQKNIYVIGRISVFQDAHLVKVRPDLAVKRKSDGAVWKDRKGISWIDPGAREAWDYIAAIARAAHREGFDELNFDYIRFPSDGDMFDIAYPTSEGRVKAEVLEEFFAHLRISLDDLGAPLSADLFGMTTTNTDDLNIGQVLEKALPYFDYVAPMVYPSHYPPGFIGLSNPAAMPYEVVAYSMQKAVARASTTPAKLRPWLQDFHLGADYTPAMIRAQIKATNDSGLDSWMFWNASNRYTSSGYLPESEQ